MAHDLLDAAPRHMAPPRHLMAPSPRVTLLVRPFSGTGTRAPKPMMRLGPGDRTQGPGPGGPARAGFEPTRPGNKGATQHQKVPSRTVIGRPILGAVPFYTARDASHHHSPPHERVASSSPPWAQGTPHGPPTDCPGPPRVNRPSTGLMEPNLGALEAPITALDRRHLAMALTSWLLARDHYVMALDLLTRPLLTRGPPGTRPMALTSWSRPPDAPTLARDH